jgi:hypothetical protein
MGEMRNVHKIFVGKPEMQRPLGRPRRRWEGNIGIGLKEISLEDVNLVHLAYYRGQWWDFVNMVMNLGFP